MCAKARGEIQIILYLFQRGERKIKNENLSIFYLVFRAL